MAPGSDRSLSTRDTVLFLLCVGLSLGMLARPDLGERITDRIRVSILWPLLQIQEWSEASRSSRAVLDRLQMERDSATHAAQFLPSLRAENQRLRSLLGLGARLPVPFVAAEVLHQALPTDGRTLILAAGSRQGVKPFDPVIDAEGLIGVVRSVEAERSVAWTWLHPEFRASAYTIPNQVFGVIQSAMQVTGSDQLLQLRGVAIRDSVPPGTIVVTSGLGGVYPPGIPLGTVVGQAQEETGWERIYVVRPAAIPASATQVMILRGPRDPSLREAFRGDSAQ